MSLYYKHLQGFLVIIFNLNKTRDKKEDGEMKNHSAQKRRAYLGILACYKYFHYTYCKNTAFKSAKILFYWIVTLI